MELLDFAIKLEQDAQQMYREAGQITSSPAIRTMCGMLVEDEQRHERIVRELKANRTAYVEGDWGRLRNVYSELVKSGHELIEESDDLKALLAKAQQMEHEAAQMYQDLADEMQNPQQKELALRLRGEELKHEKLVELTHEYVANPATVLEDSEFLWYGHEGMP